MNTVLVVVPCDCKGKKQSSLRLTVRDEYPQPLPILTIESDYRHRGDEYRSAENYTIEEFPCSGDFYGRGFRLRKESDQAVYDVFVPHRGVDELRCDCLGFERHGHCKHTQAMQEIVAQDVLPDPLKRPLDVLPIWPCIGGDPFVDDMDKEVIQAKWLDFLDREQGGE